MMVNDLNRTIEKERRERSTTNRIQQLHLPEMPIIVGLAFTYYQRF